MSESTIRLTTLHRIARSHPGEWLGTTEDGQVLYVRHRGELSWGFGSTKDDAVRNIVSRPSLPVPDKSFLSDAEMINLLHIEMIDVNISSPIRADTPEAGAFVLQLANKNEMIRSLQADLAEQANENTRLKYEYEVLEQKIERWESSITGRIVNGLQRAFNEFR